MQDRHSRQSFLGDNAEGKIRSIHIGIVGLGGGGSHIVQQLAHVGFMNFAIFDPDRVEHSNLNRLVGATYQDAVHGVRKVEIAARVIREINPGSTVAAFPSRWEESPDPLKRCDLVFGCLDSMSARRDFEAFARRHLLPYIDIGLDVHKVPGQSPQMAGQIILSMPGEHCMRCMGFITDTNLAAEAARYGDAGIRPQVVWANGVLASTAVGIAVDLLTDWTQQLRKPPYLSYDANSGLLVEHPRAHFLPPNACPHYLLRDAGDPVYLSL